MTQWGLDTLFNPAKRHMDEEKRRLQSTREEVGDSSGGKRIDLESGKVSIAKRQDEGESAAEETSDTTPAEKRTPAKKQTSDAKQAEESPARARARARRERGK
jgi:hypothetical protein